MFITVLLQIHSMKSRIQRTSRLWKRGFLQDLKSAFSLMFLLGLTWGFVFFAWGAVRIFFLYLFSIFNTLQGNSEWNEFCYNYNTLGPWNRNKFVIQAWGKRSAAGAFVLRCSAIFTGKLHCSGMMVLLFRSQCSDRRTIQDTNSCLWNMGPSKSIFSESRTILFIQAWKWLIESTVQIILVPYLQKALPVTLSQAQRSQGYSGPTWCWSRDDLSAHT